jgi:hypothetical protein
MPLSPRAGWHRHFHTLVQAYHPPQKDANSAVRVQYSGKSVLGSVAKAGMASCAMNRDNSLLLLYTANDLSVFIVLY